jgi:predicted DsbA family dithiol-disulfide isomerase
MLSILGTSGHITTAVATDASIARAAGVEGVPTFFLFRDRRLRTSFAGPQNYGVFERALGY